MLRLSKRTRSQTGLREVHCRHSLIIVVESTPWWWQLSIRICLWIDVMGREICGAGRWAHLLVYEEREEDGEQKEEEMTIDIHRPTKQIHQQVIIDQCAFTSTHSLCTPGKVTLQQAIKPCRHKQRTGGSASHPRSVPKHHPKRPYPPSGMIITGPQGINKKERKTSETAPTRWYLPEPELPKKKKKEKEKVK